MFRAQLRRLLRDNRGNVALMFAASLFPLSFLIGMGIDYTMASDRQAQLNGFADAAALAAVTPTMMAQADSVAKTAATSTFNAQAQQLNQITYTPSNLTVSVSTDSTGKRTATVAYTAASPTFFSSLLGTNQINLGGTSTATGGLAPNIDFYLLLDDSPSMAIGASAADISSLVTMTASYPSAYQSCGFGCHEANPGTPSGKDLYTLAHNKGITLRMDLVTQAAQNLMTQATTTMNNTDASYRMAIYSFDAGFTKVQALTSNMTTAKTGAGKVTLQQVYGQGYLTSSTYNNDTDTDFDNAFTNINTAMPDPGSGTSTAGDTPQEVLFLVTDGAQDKNWAQSGTCPSVDTSLGTDISWSGGSPTVKGCRQQSVINTSTDWCTRIKSRGIRIAVLYTVYNPLTSNSWYNTYWKPIQPTIGTTLATCASPGLFYEVQNGGDISAALSQLFTAAVQSAYLAK
jgi:Flp pilus assembly protein TadG